MSSANSVVANWNVLRRSLTYIENSKGPKTEPCGAPYSPIDGSHNFCSIFTQIIRRARYDCKKLKIESRNP